MSDGLEVTIGSRTFNGPWSPGTTWSLDITAGWWDSPEADADLLATIAPGSARGRTMERHRTIACRIVISAPTPVEFFAALAELESLVTIYTEVPFVVHEPEPKYVMVTLAEGGRLIRVHGTSVIECTLVVVSTSPDKLPYPPA